MAPDTLHETPAGVLARDALTFFALPDVMFTVTATFV